ncbi:GtrA family protein [Actinomadura miaoliensis]|uniref:GtrA/DPMS transmembrane domain-containing protein n=1 Tax=Actinomadura miaoliensis TaxID=430685 RepID=A0ABP7V245_9ACTN
MTATAPTRPADPAARGGGRSFRRVFTRYTIGSVLAAVASEAVLLLTYGPGLLGPQAASVAAWAAGAALNYGLNRWWAWGRRGRADLRRELLPYWVIALTTMALSAWATGVADRQVDRLVESDALRAALVGGVFLAVYGVMFVVKFVLFHYLVFADGGRSGRRPRPARRSRHQVPNTTRE